MTIRKYFIDYCTLFFYHNYKEKAAYDYHYALNQELKEYSNQYNGIQFYSNGNGIKCHIKGIFFSKPNFSNNIKEIVSFSEDFFKNYNGLLNESILEDTIISRLDIATNLPYFLNTSNGRLKLPKKRKNINIFWFYANEVKKENLNGISIGLRLAKSASYRLVAYDKRYSLTDNVASLNRFNTYNYTRLEYQVTRHPLRKILGIESLKELKKYIKQPYDTIIQILRNNKDIIFDEEYNQFNSYQIDDYINAKGIEIKKENLDCQISASSIL